MMEKTSVHSCQKGKVRKERRIHKSRLKHFGETVSK